MVAEINLKLKHYATKFQIAKVSEILFGGECESIVTKLESGDREVFFDFTPNEHYSGEFFDLLTK